MLCQLRWNSATMHTSVGIFFHENRGHSHFYFGSFPLLSIPIPNLEFNFHSRGIPTVFPFPSGIPFPWSSLCHSDNNSIETTSMRSVAKVVLLLVFFVKYKFVRCFHVIALICSKQQLHNTNKYEPQ